MWLHWRSILGCSSTCLSKRRQQQQMRDFFPPVIFISGLFLICNDDVPVTPKFTEVKCFCWCSTQEFFLWSDFLSLMLASQHFLLVLCVLSARLGHYCVLKMMQMRRRHDGLGAASPNFVGKFTALSHPYKVLCNECVFKCHFLDVLAVKRVTCCCWTPLVSLSWKTDLEFPYPHNLQIP